MLPPGDQRHESLVGPTVAGHQSGRLGGRTQRHFNCGGPVGDGRTTLTAVSVYAPWDRTTTGSLYADAAALRVLSVDQWHGEVDPTYGVSLSAFLREQPVARSVLSGRKYGGGAGGVAAGAAEVWSKGENVTRGRGERTGVA